jgi:hypothetical protein
MEMGGVVLYPLYPLILPVRGSLHIKTRKDTGFQEIAATQLRCRQLVTEGG